MYPLNHIKSIAVLLLKLAQVENILVNGLHNCRIPTDKHLPITKLQTSNFSTFPLHFSSKKSKRFLFSALMYSTCQGSVQAILRNMGNNKKEKMFCVNFAYHFPLLRKL